MKQDVIALEPKSKKLGEWDSDKKIFTIKLKGYIHELKLDKVNTFCCISSRQSIKN